MVGPIPGGGGSPSIPGIPDTPGGPDAPTFGDTTFTSPSGETFTQVFLANTPKMSTLEFMKSLADARINDIAEQFRGEAQRAELRKEDYAANADLILTGIQRAEALLIQSVLYLNVATNLDGFFDDIETDVADQNEIIGPDANPDLNTQYEITENLNNAIIAWNQAKANYQANPNPTTEAALDAATLDYGNALFLYELARQLFNPLNASYNAIVQPKQDILDQPNGGVNEQLQQINSLRLILGLDPIVPGEYNLIAPLMVPTPDFPDISDLNNLPPDVATLALPAQIDITVPDINDATNEFVNSFVTAINLIINDSQLATRGTNVSADAFDYLFFILKEKPNPAIVEAFIESHPDFTAAAVGTSGDVALPGASPITAALATTPGNLFLTDVTTQAIYDAQLQAQKAPLSENEVEAIARRVNSDLNAVGFTTLNDIKLVAAIQTRDTLGPNLAHNDPAVRTLAGLETITGIENFVNSGALERNVNQSIQAAVGNNPEIADALRTPLLAAVKAQLQFVAANELGEAVGNPNVGAQILLATPGLEQLQGLLAGSAISQDADILRTPFAQAFTTVSIADRIALGGDTSPGEAIAEAEGILNELLAQGVLTPEEFRKALLEALQKIGLEAQKNVIDAILGGIDGAQNPATLNQRINAERLKRDLILEQVTDDRIEQEAIDRAFQQSVLTAQDLLASVQASLLSAGIGADRASALADQTARVSLLQSSVLEGIDNRLKQLPPDQRKFVEEEFLSTIHVPQKAKVEAREDRINPLSIPNQIAEVLSDLANENETGTIGAIVEDARRSARETAGDFVQRKRAQDLARIYLHQTAETGSPYVDNSALPTSNFSKPASTFNKIEMSG